MLASPGAGGPVRCNMDTDLTGWPTSASAPMSLSCHVWALSIEPHAITTGRYEVDTPTSEPDLATNT